MNVCNCLCVFIPINVDNLSIFKCGSVIFIRVSRDENLPLFAINQLELKSIDLTQKNIAE